MKCLYLFVCAFLLPTLTISQITFTDIADAAGIGEVGYNYGVSIIDYDKDGWEDIYITRRQGPNRLWRNMGNETFTEVAAAAGVDYGGDAKLAVWGDINNDGHIDLFLGTLNEGDHLYLNDGDGTFSDISTPSGMYAQKECIGAMFGDYDNDGLIDLYCARLADQNTLYRNMGNNTFSDVTFQTGATDTLTAMGAMFIDYDNDGDQDIYLVHDARWPNILYQNNGQGQFTDVAVPAGVDYAGFGMGVDAGDINHDGWMDLYISNLYHNTCYLNNGDGTFTDISTSAGVNDNGMGWSTAFVDVDNDGWQDVYLSNTPFSSIPFPNVLYRNKGDHTFEVISENTSLASGGNGFGMATGDINQDGWPDLIVANSVDSRGNELFRNLTSLSHHFVSFLLEGTTSNRSAIGARVDIKANGFWQADAVTAGSGWASQNSLRLHFGVGTATNIDSVIIRWPSGQIEYFENLAIDQLHHITETPASVGIEQRLAESWNLQVSPNPFWNQVNVSFLNLQAGFVQLELMEVNGQVIARKSMFVGEGLQTVRWELPSISAGFYLLRIETSMGTVVRQLGRTQ